MALRRPFELPPGSEQHMYSEEEFVDTVAMTGSVLQFDDDIAAEVDTSVQHMLLSVSSIRQHLNAFCDLLLRWSRENTLHNALLVSCAQIMRKEEHYPNVFRFFPNQIVSGIMRGSEVILHERIEIAQLVMLDVYNESPVSWRRREQQSRTVRCGMMASFNCRPTQKAMVSRARVVMARVRSPKV